MKNRKYPWDLFVIGVITNMLFHYFWIAIPCVICSIAGIFVETLGPVALVLFLIDLILSIIEQIKIRNAFMEDSDNPDFQKFQDFLSRDGDWLKNTKDFIERNIESNDDDDDEDE